MLELVQMLTDRLGVSEKQAKGGSGLLLKLAKERLDDQAFQRVAAVVPAVEMLLSEAPEDEGVAGLVGDLASAFTGKDSNISRLGTIASIAGGFSKLGMNAEMISKFVPIVLSFVQDRGDDDTKRTLEDAIK